MSSKHMNRMIRKRIAGMSAQADFPAGMRPPAQTGERQESGSSTYQSIDAGVRSAPIQPKTDLNAVIREMVAYGR